MAYLAVNNVFYHTARSGKHNADYATLK